MLSLCVDPCSSRGALRSGFVLTSSWWGSAAAIAGTARLATIDAPINHLSNTDRRIDVLVITNSSLLITEGECFVNVYGGACGRVCRPSDDVHNTVDGRNNDSMPGRGHWLEGTPCIRRR